MKAILHILLLTQTSLGCQLSSLFSSFGPFHEENQQNLKDHSRSAPAYHTLPSWYTSTLLARRLLHKSTVGTIATVFPDKIVPDPAHHWQPPSSLASLPVALPEYIAACSDSGNPTVLGLDLGTTFKNVAFGSNVSLSIDWWDHLPATKVPGLRGSSRAALPRAVLMGYMDPYPIPLDTDTRSERAAHSGFWAQLVVQQVMWIGGFGDRALIGWVNMTEWSGIQFGPNELGVGDGRGWGDVSLPGEKH
ncbi:unnamed protein product [Penicillium manginii]